MLKLFYIQKKGDIHMLEINTSDLKCDINNLNSLIDEYEEIQLNLFNQLKDSCINWQDGNSLKFDNNIYLERKEAELILQTLKDKRDVFNFIYSKYSEIGKKISCNLNNKNKLLQAINNCESRFNSIINEFRKIDNSFYYQEYNITKEQNSCG